MRTFLLLLLTVSNLAFASGKFSVTPSYFIRSEKVGGTAGLAIYEPIVAGVAYNGWTGMGLQPRVSDPTVVWVTSRHDFERWFGDFGLAIGYTFVHADQPLGDLFISDHNAHVKATWKLW